MRNPERINAVLAKLREIWEKSPDLRLGQLIGNVIDDVYNVEDEVLVHRLDAFYVQKIPLEQALEIEAKITEQLRTSRHASLRSPIRMATTSEREAQEREEADAQRDEVLANGGGGYGAL
jgi:uncharacterized protein YihD (DUF1040 family)